jgi:hypothetical protein
MFQPPSLAAFLFATFDPACSEFQSLGGEAIEQIDPKVVRKFENKFTGD